MCAQLQGYISLSCFPLKYTLISDMAVIQICFLVIMFLAVTDAQSSNNTSEETTPLGASSKQVGWKSGANTRSTLNILYTCLSTIITCTWAILHLNVPHQEDSKSVKIKRKLKWMAATIIFPEFLFAHAMAERKMALNDLRLMQKKKKEEGLEHLGGWQVRGYEPLWEKIRKWWKVGAGEKNSNTVPSNDTPQEEDSVSTPNRTWTLTHSYYANMGGIVIRFNVTSQNGPNRLERIETARGFASYNRDDPPNPLAYFFLSEASIRDRSKADPLVKVVAIMQILWLLLSVISRLIQRVPTSQLEIMTLSFAACAIATYSAYWNKPKDVEFQEILNVPGGLDENSRNYQNKWGDDFFYVSYFRLALIPGYRNSTATHRVQLCEPRLTSP
jgi:hypothetical protein